MVITSTIPTPTVTKFQDPQQPFIHSFNFQLLLYLSFSQNINHPETPFCCLFLLPYWLNFKSISFFSLQGEKKKVSFFSKLLILKSKKYQMLNGQWHCHCTFNNIQKEKGTTTVTNYASHTKFLTKKQKGSLFFFYW